MAFRHSASNIVDKGNNAVVHMELISDNACPFKAAFGDRPDVGAIDR